MNDPRRGEVWLVDLGLAAKVRPCLVLSVPAADTDRALVALVPHTTSLRGTRFECIVPVGFLKAGAFDVQGIVTVPHAKLLRRLGGLRPEQLAAVEAAVGRWLGLRP
ncbi:MAG TPA: type II toxin-antitoxin system PemK/MazF family toxin [Thermoanaerobaculia bacterium]|nr:type II toxin-antitoxin system PemK/MazF family toxin [Thermoanaerobaculia bacterium]